jgi:diguanylate cyclase (GGDEF)-like protein
MVYKNIFSIPVSGKHQTSMKRRFIIFSSVLFLLIFIFGSVVFIVLMDRIHYRNAGSELIQTIEIERLKLEAAVNSEIALALSMADSPIIRQYFLNPADDEMQKLAFEEIDAYRRAFTKNSVFLVNDIDKKFFFNDDFVYTVDPENPMNYWYLMTMHQTERYNFNINFNPDLNVTDIWINAQVFDSKHKPIGIVGTGINLSDFVDAIYKNYRGSAELYFFNSAWEITGADNVGLVENKVNITGALGPIGWKISAMTNGLRSGEIKYTWIKDNKQIAAIGLIPALDWYIIAVRSFSMSDSLQTGMTALFGVMMTVIFSVFVVFNIFVVGMLEPLNRMIKTVNRTLSDWEIKPREGISNADELGTLGEFLDMTIIDPLTGIYNRRYLDGYVKNIIKSLARNFSNLSLLIIDIDYFKQYNDTYGHDMGDDCLREITSVLTQCITRDEDFIARYGGEEFVVVLPNTDSNGVQVIAEKLLEKVRGCNIPHKSSKAADRVTVSIGGTTGIVKHFHNESDYVKCADKALYESKENGRNRYTFEPFEG